MSLFSQFTSRAGGDIMVYFGGGRRDIVKGMSIAEVYRTQPELQAVVSFVSRSIAQLPLKCYVREEDNSRVRDTEGPLATLLANPAPDMTTFDLVLGLVGDLKLYGWALWWVVPSASAPSGRELRAIPPDWAKIKTEDGFTPSAYVLSNPATNGRQITVPADQFVRFATYNPGQPLTPLSPVESLRDVLSERASSRDYRGKIWRNGGWFSRYIKRPLQAPDWAKGGENSPKARFARSWKARFAGSGGTDTGGTPILEDGMELVESRINAKEAEWAESMRLTREDVAAAYHLNPAQVWSNEGQTYASVKENARSLYADTLGPDLTLIQDCINTKLAPMVGEDPRCYAEFDLSAKLAGSFEEQASVLSQSVGGPYMTRNEARAKQNLPAIEGGDELIVPLNVTEGGLASPHDTKAAWVPSVQEEAVPALVAPKARDLIPESGQEGKDVDPTGRKRENRIRVKALPEVERSVEEAIRAFCKRQLDGYVGGLAKVDLGSTTLAQAIEEISEEKLGTWTADAVAELYRRTKQPMAAAAARSMALLGVDPEGLDEGTLRELARDVCVRHADGIAQSALESLIEAASAEEVKDARSARRIVHETFASKVEPHIKEHSTAVSTYVASAGACEGARQSGAECQKEWVISRQNTRDSHMKMDGERVGIDERFSNGARWPHDTNLSAAETCNCRCRLEIIGGEDRASGKHLKEVRREAEDGTKAINLAWIEFKSEKNEPHYQETVGKVIRSWSKDNLITATFYAKPIGKELQAARALADAGHTVEFLNTLGDGQHPDIKVDGLIADLKRIESFRPNAVYKRIKHAVGQGAELAVIDLAYDRVTLEDALAKASEAIADGIIQSGNVIIVDWHGALHYR